jgi:hypothetical protein
VIVTEFPRRYPALITWGALPRGRAHLRGGGPAMINADLLLLWPGCYPALINGGLGWAWLTVGGPRCGKFFRTRVVVRVRGRGSAELE